MQALLSLLSQDTLQQHCISQAELADAVQYLATQLHALKQSCKDMLKQTGRAPEHATKEPCLVYSALAQKLQESLLVCNQAEPYRSNLEEENNGVVPSLLTMTDTTGQGSTPPQRMTAEDALASRHSMLMRWQHTAADRLHSLLCTQPAHASSGAGLQGAAALLQLPCEDLDASERQPDSSNTRSSVHTAQSASVRGFTRSNSSQLQRASSVSAQGLRAQVPNAKHSFALLNKSICQHSLARAAGSAQLGLNFCAALRTSFATMSALPSWAAMQLQVFAQHGNESGLPDGQGQKYGTSSGLYFGCRLCAAASQPALVPSGALNWTRNLTVHLQDLASLQSMDAGKLHILRSSQLVQLLAAANERRLAAKSSTPAHMLSSKAHAVCVAEGAAAEPYDQNGQAHIACYAAGRGLQFPVALSLEGLSS